ncbi:MAG: flagellar hook-basal body complex protein [Calditrichaeota bacterium]|nr:MAG: flagellar hook-basal body complex protein [Calditrichota bacterium]MBL1204011.1 flagellar hook-basal body complex protein [Calditrichota bacterium]NOG43842.1 flagellar hook-basal body complex protein [Calditrichota bacterium]
MLKALQSGVSGLRNHQMKIDVLGNNIANVNTVGFKGGRIMFSEALNQTVKNATPGSGTGFINPVQVGLGMNTSSIENIFTQGGLENTGVITDLALEGEGFFMVKSGENNLYTRSGNFFFNSDGKLVNTKGLAVQGWQLNGSQTTGGLGVGNTEDIVIDSGLVSPAESTQNVYMNGNINAGNRTVAEIWQSPSAFANKAIATGTAGVPAFPMPIDGTNNELTINIQDNPTSTIAGDLTLTAGTYADLNALVAELNTQIAATANISTRVEAVNNGGTLEFHQLNGTSSTTISLSDGTNTALATIGYADGDSATASIADSTTALNNLLGVSTFSESLTNGDTIEISGTNPDGSVVTATFTYGAANDGTTLGELATIVESSFSGVTVTIDSGTLVVTDNVAGDSSTTVNLSNGSSNIGSVTFPGFTNTVPGNTGTATTSVLVYDSLGASHNLILEFTNTENANEWTWEATTTGDSSVASGGTGRVTFDENGNMTSFSHDGGVSQLTLNPGNGADQVDILLHAESSDEFSGLSQFDSVSTLNVREQDGKSTGALIGITIDRDGIISGSFSNGDISSMAKIAIAQFPNNIGLSDLGDGLYATSIASGDPQILNPDSDATSSIVSGALEMSNVDLADEFTELITAQRGFQANAKIITTADSILDEVIRLKR